METKKGRKPLLSGPMRRDEEEDTRRRLQLPSDARKKRRRRKGECHAELPPLSQSVESFCFPSVAPGEEARKMSRRCRRKKIDLWTTESATDAMEGLWREMPIRRRPETRCRVREKVLLRGNEDGENTEAQGMGEEKHFPGEKKKRERYRATFSFHIGDSRRAVRPPEEIACVDGWGKEDPEEDDEGHELLGIDMGWGIHNVLPETLKQTSLEINTPALVRRIRRHLQVAILHSKRPHRGCALERPQRCDPVQISNRFRR